MNCIIISPHCDDAVLSCWHFLQQNNAVIMTFFGNSQFSFNQSHIKSHSFRMAEELYFAIKTKRNLVYYHLPEIQTLNTLGIGSEKFSYCYKKRTESLKYLLNNLLSKYRNALFVLPLGIGRHPDHTLIRDVFIELSDNSMNLIFYEDQFYRSIYNESEVEHTTGELGFSLKSLDFKINHNDKISTFIKYYPSQVEAKYIDAMQNYYRVNNVETYWIPKNVNLE